MKSFTLTINQPAIKFKVEEQMPLLWLLQDKLNLVGTKFGCGKGLCGACTVLLNGQADQILSTVSLLNNSPEPTDTEIENALSGNICRCGTYNRIRRAVKKDSRLANKSSMAQNDIEVKNI